MSGDEKPSAGACKLGCKTKHDRAIGGSSEAIGAYGLE
jgi:hypothetical protein